jgi:hypothetical protein
MRWPHPAGCLKQYGAKTIKVQYAADRLLTA